MTFFSIVGIGIFFLLIVYLFKADNENDLLFFRRENEFRNKLDEHGYGNTLDLAYELFNVSKDNWTFDGAFNMVTHPFAKTRINFNTMTSPELRIIEGSGTKQIMRAVYFDDTETILYEEFNPYFSPTPEDRFKLKQLIFHLMDVQKTLQKERKNAEITEKREKEEINKKNRVQLQQTLKELLAKHEYFSGEITQDGLVLSKKEDERSSSFTITYEGVLHFQALLIKKTMRFNSEFSERHAFQGLEKLLNEYSYRLLTEKR